VGTTENRRKLSNLSKAKKITRVAPIRGDGYFNLLVTDRTWEITSSSAAMNRIAARSFNQGEWQDGYLSIALLSLRHKQGGTGKLRSSPPTSSSEFCLFGEANYCLQFVLRREPMRRSGG